VGGTSFVSHRRDTNQWLSDSITFYRQTPQWPCTVWKRLSRDCCCRVRLEPGCHTAGSSTREKLTTWADLQFSFHWLLMSKDTKYCHRGFLDGRIGQLSCATIFFTSLSVAAFLRRSGRSILARTGNLEEDWNVKWRIMWLYVQQYIGCLVSSMVEHCIAPTRVSGLIPTSGAEFLVYFYFL